LEFARREFPARIGAKRRALIAGLLLLAAASQIRSEEAIRSLTLEEALALAEQRNPTLLAQAQAIQSAKATEVTAGLRPNPNLQNDTTSSTAGIYQEIEVGGKRGARLDSARLATSVSTTDYADTRRTVVLGVRQAFIAALLARANVVLARENLASFQRVVDLNRLRLEKGALSGSDFLKIELQTLQYQSDLEDATLALKTARASLRSLLGGAGLAGDFEVKGDLAAVPFDKSLAELEQLALARRPDLKSAETGIGKSDADVRLAEANRYPDPTVGVSYLHTGNEIGGPAWFQPFFPKGQATNSMGLGVSFPVPLFNRNQGEIARTRSERQRADFLAQAVLAQVIQDVETAYAAFESSRERVRLYEGAYLSRAKESRDIAEFAFQKGAISLLDLLDAERTYRATQLAYRQSLAGYMTSLAQLEAAVGGTVAP
jgi:cobalt-zinc-cadmium efflux system outer membrane protein